MLQPWLLQQQAQGAAVLRQGRCPQHLQGHTMRLGVRPKRGWGCRRADCCAPAARPSWGSGRCQEASSAHAACWWVQCELCNSLGW